MKAASSLQHYEVVGGIAMHASQNCSSCQVGSRVRHRDFSEQVWSILLLWGEIREDSADQMFCDDCYRDLREVLIERGREMELVLKSGPVSLQSAVEARRQAAKDAPEPKKAQPQPPPRVAKTTKASPEKKASVRDVPAKGAPKAVVAKKGRPKIAS